MKKFFLATVFFIFIISFAGYAGSQASGFQTFDEMLRQMDGNRDSRITRAEWKGTSDMFIVLDRNGNGVLIRPEYREVMDDYKMNYDEGLDQFRIQLRGDETHPIAAAAFPGYNNPYGGAAVPFSELDKNGDGVLTAEEFASWFAYETLKAQRGITIPPGEPEDWLPFNAMLKLMDRDRNGRVGAVEWKGTAELFDILDRDNNRSITQQEYDRVMKDYKANYDEGLDQFRMQLRGDETHPITAAAFPGYNNPYNGAAVAFSDLDKNGDGILTAEEFASWFAYETLKAQHH